MARSSANFVVLLLAATAITTECKRVVEGKESGQHDEQPPHSDPYHDAEKACHYADSVGFQVGDKVRMYKPGSHMHNSIATVACPGSTEGSSGEVCLADASEKATGCFNPDALRKMNSFTLALVRILSRAKQFAQANQAKASEAWPVVQQKLATYARITLDKALALAMHFLTAVNICDADVRQKVGHAFASIESGISIIAGAVTEIWPSEMINGRLKPAVQSVITVAAKTAKAAVTKLGAMLVKNAKTVSRDAAREVHRLNGALYKNVNELIKGALEENPTISKVVEGAKSFVEKVQEFNAKFKELLSSPEQWPDEWRIDRAWIAASTAAMNGLERAGGILVSAAAARWSEVKAALQDILSQINSGIKELGGQAIEAVNLCNPEVQERLAGAFALVEGRVGQLATAITEHWPAVQERLTDLTEDMSQRLSALATYPGAEAAVASTQKKVAQLKELLSQTSTNAQSKAKALADEIVASISALIAKFTNGEAGDLEDSEEIAEEEDDEESNRETIAEEDDEETNAEEDDAAEELVSHPL